MKMKTINRVSIFKAVMGNIGVIVVLIAIYFTSTSSAIGLNNTNPLEAYACDDCSFEEAKQIATLKAPKNTCSIWRNGPSATYCETISKQIIVAAIGSENIYNFIVNTSINSQNTQSIGVFSSPFISSTQRDLVQEFFVLYEQLEDAVNEVNQDLSLRPSVKGFGYFSTLAQGEESCENHPTNYFKSIGKERGVKTSLYNSIKQGLENSAWSDIKYQGLVSSTQFGVSLDGVNLGIGLQYVNKDLIVTKFYGAGNYLSFNVIGGSSLDNNSSLIIGLELNTRLSQIDGVSVTTLFGRQTLDLSDTLMSACWIRFLEEEGEEVPSPSVSSGSGTLQDPYDGEFSSNSNYQYCIKRRAVKTCSTTEDGSESCNRSTISWVSACN
jgi:hypothetical protein